MLKRMGNFFLGVIGEIVKKVLVYGTLVVLVFIAIYYLLGVNVLKVFGV